VKFFLISFSKHTGENEYPVFRFFQLCDVAKINPMARTTGSDELFTLIHSLTTEEKGYFKKYAKRHTPAGNNYLTLFDAINKQTVFEEATLKRQFKAYAGMKVYLFDMIMQALVVSETSPTLFDVILKGIIQVNILIKRGLLKRALKQLQAYKLMATQAEQYGLLVLLLKIEFSNQLLTWPPRERLLKIKAAYNALREAYEKQLVTDNLHEQQNIVMSLVRLDSNFAEKIDPAEWMDMALLAGSKKNTGHLAEKYRLSALAIAYSLQQNNEECHRITGQIFELEKARWEKGPDKSMPLDLLKAINNYATSSIATKDFKQAEKLVEMLPAIEINNPAGLLENRIRYSTIKAEVLWCTGRHAQGEKFCNEVIEKYHLTDYFKRHWSKLIHLVGEKVMFEFSNKHYKQALQTLNFFNPSATAVYSVEDRKHAEFLRLIIQYEIGNTELIPAMVKSITKRNKILSEHDKAILTAFGKYYQSEKKLIAYLKQFRPDILILKILTFNDWLESKIERTPLYVQVQKNYGTYKTRRATS
jgi:hypothetical protein